MRPIGILLLLIPTLAQAVPFKFCVSTAAHQVEGHNSNSDWWDWEHEKGRIKNGDTSEIAGDSWNHVDDDIAAMKDLGIDTYRFSIEWAKVEPREGEFDPAVLDRYLQLVRTLRQNKIEPMVTLYHFTLPKWAAAKGGWEWDGIVEALDRYTHTVAQAFAAKAPRDVQLWNTINEPMSIVVAGYISNVFPPGKNDLRTIAKPMLLMLRAHARMYHALHQHLDRDDFKIRAGLAHHLRVFEPARHRNFLDRYMTRKFDEIFNWALPDALIDGHLKFRLPFVTKSDEYVPEAIGTQDFFGLNYYTRDLVSFHLFAKDKLQRSTPEGAAVSDLGWEIFPSGMGQILDELRKRYPSLSVWITENGIADAHDQHRAAFIRDHLQVIQDQLKQGARIEGYCHWTLYDNFEWAEGYQAKFGLYSLNLQTGVRTPRPSAREFKKQIRSFRKSGFYATDGT